ncbi:hypothetical protein ES703_21840 [subsurface metagenome]
MRPLLFYGMRCYLLSVPTKERIPAVCASAAIAEIKRSISMLESFLNSMRGEIMIDESNTVHEMLIRLYNQMELI